MADGSSYVGSGQLDGNGIPLDFFNDINMRKALATRFNYDLYNQEVLLGQGVRNNGPYHQWYVGLQPRRPDI